MVASMADEENHDIPMAECGACGAIIPLDSQSCPSCNIRIGGISEEEIGECGVCGAIIPIDSESCSECGAVFVASEESDDETFDDSDNVDEVSEPEEVGEELSVDDNADTEEDLEEIQVVTSEETDTSSENEEELEDDDSEEEVSEEDESEEEVSEEDESEDVMSEEEDSEEEVSEEEDSEEEVSEEEDSEDESDDELEVAEGDTDESEEESSDDISDEEDRKNLEYWRTTVVMAFENLALAIAESGMTASEAFVTVDSNEDQLIDAPELQKGIEKISGEWLTPNQVKAILEYLDTNENNRVDPNELVKALDDLKIGIKPGKFPKPKKEKEFPSNAQKFLIGKKANDILYPVMYFFMVTIIGIFVVNGMGIIVDGSGGNVVYEGSGENWNHCGTEVGDSLGDDCNGFVNNGETYPCDKTIDEADCRNSLTPFSGDGDDGLLNSMPAGFYMDGILIIILATIGLGLTAYLHLVYVPALRVLVKNGGKPKEEVESDSEGDDENTESEEESSSEDEPDDDEEEDSEDLSDDEEDESEDDYEEDDDDDSEDDDIDVGSWVGIEIDGEEFFGEIIEFDDDEGTVTIETEDGEEITGDQDEMFLEDDE